MAHQTLSDADIAQFIDHGYVLVKQAYARADALEAQDFLWDRLIERHPAAGLRKDDPQTWQSVIAQDAASAFPTLHLREFFNEPVFKRCETERLAGAIEDLIGVGRWALKHQPHNWGWWPINFGVGASRPWAIPTGGWHWDGMGRQHFVHSPEQGLLVLPCFSDVASHGGGTLIASGSHRIVARYLGRHPEGKPADVAIRECAAEHPWLAELTGSAPSTGDRSRFLETSVVDGVPLRVVETIAEAGDVLLGHPFLFHAASQNHSGKPRFMCNRAAPLTAPIDLTRADTPLEISIRRALEG